MPSIPPELQLKRRNSTLDIKAAAAAVDSYIPILDFRLASCSPPYTTTIISAFFAPPQSELLIRSMGGDPFHRDPDEYIQALQLMTRTCRNLLLVLSAMRPLRPLGTAYWPRVLEDGMKLDAYMDNIHSIVANLYFGNTAAMARLSRVQLILMERDLARGYFVG
ncbi:uncharacterized protein BDV17DRAFT_291198 [Aspergillus undulatus]|uniref:uncharacterized protein n=1 Tax=Aspergillus undulatus TaxID=1810928 RepID=UPI003CCE3274